MRGLTDCREKLNTLALLEQEGTTFMDKQKHHTKRRRYIAQDPADAPPLPVLALLGVILALVCRLREIQKGEEDNAKQY